ncbi:hypothetical protein [Pantoea sp.]|uniref:hypothetical protein n=1 Tax=Pantoea sp. TaxID=69393 RepID=UPI0028ABBAEB|nr:hypothetical protein [Pantoea sp.]
MTEFERGVFYAAYLICELHDEPTVAADVIREAGLETSDISVLDDCEREALLPLNESEKLALSVEAK